MVELWHRLAVAADQLQGEIESEVVEVEGLTMSELGAAVRLLPAPEHEDEDFPSTMNILVLSCPDVTETLQTCLTTVMQAQQSTLSSYLPHILGKVQKVALMQLGGGECPLKAATLDLLSAFHAASGPGPLHFWAEEAAWLGQIVTFFTSPTITLVTERQLIGEALSKLASTLTTRWSKEEVKDEMVLMAVHFLPHWLTLVRQRLTSRLELAQEAIEQLAALLIGFGGESEENKVVECLLSSDRVQLTIVAVQLAWKEVQGSGVLDNGRDELQGKRKLVDEVEVASLCLISPIWTRLLAQLENKLDTPLGLTTFCEVVQSMLRRLLVGGHQRRSIQLVEKSLLVRLTNCLLSKFCNPDSANDLRLLLDAVETLILIGHLWPGAEHMGSEIGVLQQVVPILLFIKIIVSYFDFGNHLRVITPQTWAALLSLPWLVGHDPKDLRLDQESEIRKGAEVAAKTWGEDAICQALLLLLSLPPWIGPKWRTAVARASWTSRSKGLVTALPLLARLGSCTAGLSNQVVTALVEEKKDSGLVPVLAPVASIYLCSLARTVEMRMKLKNGRVTLYLACSSCDLPVRALGRVTPSKVYYPDV